MQRAQQYDLYNKTGTGLTTSYSAKDNRLFGTGKGAGWSPPCWAANSDVISTVMETHTSGMLFGHPNRNIISHRHIDVFVDDSSLGITKTAFNKFNPATTAPVPKGISLYHQAQLNTQFYSRLLFTTGSVFDLECSYLLLYHPLFFHILIIVKNVTLVLFFLVFVKTFKITDFCSLSLNETISQLIMTNSYVCKFRCIRL